MPTSKTLANTMTLPARQVTQRLHDKWATAVPALSTKVTVSQVPADLVHRYKYDFYGLLINLRVPEEFHYITMLVNGYTKPTQYLGDTYTINIIDRPTLVSMSKAFHRI